MAGKEELRRLYDAHAEALFRFLLSLTRSEEETREALQEVFVKLARRPGLLRKARDERAYLLRMARRAAIDRIRSRASARRLAEQAAAEAQADSLFVKAADPDEQAFREAVAAALAELPPEQRAAVHLKLWEGRTFEEIGKILGISPNTAASRYRYGLDKLRRRLRPLYEEIR
ncbi:MAG: sigma-70 family RNA polymerase sigma factor [Verrucomicrobia bacterium]|nr:sigma-70 family RNA polymerase sigma factor [Verrucomicrobiota bacterium]